MFRRILTVWTLLFAAGGGLSVAHGEVTVRFSPNPEVKEEILRRVAAAEKTLDLALYGLSHSAYEDAVAAAAERGVTVRLLLDDARDEEATVRRLEKSGVDVRYVTRILHHKFALVDEPAGRGSSPGAVLLTGSGNWSAGAYQRFDEDLLTFNKRPVIHDNFEAEFEFLWKNSRALGKNLYPESSVFDPPAWEGAFTSHNMEAIEWGGEPTFRTVVETEAGVAGQLLKDAIRSAEKSVSIATAHFRRPDIAEALTEALERGVEVRMLLDGQEYDGIPSAERDPDLVSDERLARAGARIRYKTYSRYWDFRTARQMHTKYMIVDGARVLTGSFNWSANAELNSFENLVALSDSAVAADYRAHFEEVFHYGAGEFEDLLERIRERGGDGPCHFDPIALTPAQREQLDDSYGRGACH